ncbi:hypothetical protein MKW92_002212 [Papaver armeniacum]|nr:hypothetical protein MKW92_002212 [Papaver armeniacum]
MKGSLHLVLFIAIATSMSCKMLVRTVFSTKSTQHTGWHLGEEKTEKEIEYLLQGSLGGGRHRSISSYDNHRREVEYWSSTRGIHVRPRSSNPYREHKIEFRTVLHDWFRNKRFKSDVTGDYSCAVVGNSGMFLRNEYGDMIDNQEFVIRLNNARTRGMGDWKTPEEGVPLRGGSMFRYSSDMQVRSTIIKLTRATELHRPNYEEEYAFYRHLVEKPVIIPWVKYRCTPVFLCAYRCTPFFSLL